MINKIIKKINYEFAEQFEVSAIKNLGFVPINTSPNGVYVAMTTTSNKEKITDYVAKLNGQKVNFVYLGKGDFDTVYQVFMEKFAKDTIPDEIDETNDDSLELEDETIEIDSLDIDDSDDLLNDDEDDDFLQEDEKSKPNQVEKKSSNEEKATEEKSENKEADDLDMDDESDSLEDDSIDETEDSLDDSEDDDLFDDEEEEKEQEQDDGDGKATADVTQVKAPQTKKLGEILIEEKLINDEQLQIALAESRAQGIPLGSVLVKLGFVTIKDLKEALGAQMGLQYATTAQLKALPTAISVLPEDFVKTNKVIPLSMTDKSLVIGMVNPNDKKVINEVVYQTGLKPTIMLVTYGI